jgi:putrescine aminotransferase
MCVYCGELHCYRRSLIAYRAKLEDFSLSPDIDQEAANRINEEALEKMREYHNPSLARLLKFTGYNKVEWKAEGAVVWDINGKEYIDCAGGYGVFNLGHCHPKVVQAVKDQLDLMCLSSKIFVNKPMVDLAEKLAEITPGSLRFSFFCNSGAEAVEGAIKLARMSTKKTEIIAAIDAFHGKTLGALSATGREMYKAPFRPLVGGFVHVPFGDADAIQGAINGKTAAVILEPIQGEGGIIIPPEDYFSKVRKLCTDNDVVLIIDEIQTGLGRTGKMFAIEHYGVEPDIMTLAKALGGGVMPIGAFMGTPKVWSSFAPNPLIITSTFGGNPLACVAAIAAIDAVIEENLAERADRLGQYFMQGLVRLRENYPLIIADVRGKGLMIGLELTKEGLGGLIMPEMARKGITAVYTLNNPKVIRLEPPLVISREQIDRVLKIIEDAVQIAQSKYAALFDRK